MQDWRKVAAERCRVRNTTHGMKYTPEYKAWDGMKGRCYRETDISYKNYGARGIKVCAKWKSSFKNFYIDMGRRPTPRHSLDRIKTDGNYTPANCRWATRREQANNKRSNHAVDYRGRKLSLRDAIRAAGDLADRGTVHYRITKLGWSVDRAVETPSPTWQKRRSASRKS